MPGAVPGSVHSFRDIGAKILLFIMKKAHTKVDFLSRRGDSNARPLRPERSALPTALLLEEKKLAFMQAC